MAAAKVPEAQLKTARAAAAAANEEAAAATCFDLVLTAAGQLVPELLLTTQDAAAGHQPPLLPALPPPIVVCGPFGTGKSELLQLLLDSLPGTFGVAAVHTTTQQPGSTDDGAAAGSRWGALWVQLAAKAGSRWGDLSATRCKDGGNSHVVVDSVSILGACMVAHMWCARHALAAWMRWASSEYNYLPVHCHWQRCW
jgi:hypothetical protein